ncbi:MAG TPA: hypothetical protein VMH87_09750 [Pseudomonadales bacterium]|nr:hypothetical protein [Pseudomonadales bacterium]
MVKIIIGIVMIVGGLSGKLVLIGTQSGTALAVLGAVLIVWGIFNLVRQRRGPQGPSGPQQ